MKGVRRLTVVVLLAVMSLLAGCSSSGPPVVLPTRTPIPSISAKTPTPKPTVTVTETVTATPTAEPTGGIVVEDDTAGPAEPSQTPSAEVSSDPEGVIACSAIIKVVSATVIKNKKTPVYEAQFRVAGVVATSYVINFVDQPPPPGDRVYHVPRSFKPIRNTEPVVKFSLPAKGITPRASIDTELGSIDCGTFGFK